MTNTNRVSFLQTLLQAVQVAAPRAAFTLLILLAMAAAVARPSSAQTFTVLHEFAGVPNDGSGPRGGLIRDAAGNFYGTTFSGGAVGEGTVFKMDPAGHETVLFTFNNANGSFPAAGLTFDKAGNLFGVADEGPGGAGVEPVRSLRRQILLRRHHRRLMAGCAAIPVHAIG